MFQLSSFVLEEASPSKSKNSLLLRSFLFFHLYRISINYQVLNVSQALEQEKRKKNRSRVNIIAGKDLLSSIPRMLLLIFRHESERSDK